MQFYKPPPPPARSFAARNPWRRMHAEKLVDFLILYGQKFWLPSAYGRIRLTTDLRGWQVDAAADELLAAGIVDIRPSGDGVVVALRGRAE